MTSLSEQLRKLATPQTSHLNDSKKRPSILFDKYEAATKDRQTIYDLGVQGLTELIELNIDFKQFEETLFQPTSINVERAVEDSKFNKQLDKNIHKFFHHLSPYFMLRSAHLCLEWLIRRFRVHEYNRDKFIALILPYHETNSFVKCMQIVRTKNQNDLWSFLKPLQKRGLPLPKGTLISKATAEQSFLKFVCQNVIDATKELGPRASTLQCLINFYCSIVIGSFENSGQLKEWQVTTVLPSIVAGLQSGVADFISASFIITTQLVNKCKLTNKLIDYLVKSIWKVNCEPLQNISILLLNWIAKTHADVLVQFPLTGFMEFIRSKYLNGAINTLSRDGISMLFLMAPLIKTTFHVIQNDATNTEECKRYIESLLYDVQFSNASAKQIIKYVLGSLSLEEQEKPLNDGDVIDLDDDESPTKQNILSWFTTLIQLLERQYPSEMDVVIKEVMEDKSNETSKDAIRVALGLRYKFLNADTSSVFENVYHTNPKIRYMSIKEIVKQVIEHKNEVQHLKLLKEVLADRIDDDNDKVVEEILKLPTTISIEVLGVSTFVEKLIKILDCAIINPVGWSRLQTAALTHLTSPNVVNEFDNNIILLIVIRYLIPDKITPENSKYIRLILQSSLASKKPLFESLVKKYKDNQNLSDFKENFLNVLSLSKDAPKVDELIKSMQKDDESNIRTPLQMSHFLILTTACLKTQFDLELAIKLYDFTTKQCLNFRIVLETNEQKKAKIVPLQLFVEFIDSIVRMTKFENLHDWNVTSNSLKLFFKIFSLLTSKAFSPKLEKGDKELWTKSLKDILNLLFPTVKQKLDFLSQFLIYEKLNDTTNYIETRIRALRLLEVILRGGQIEEGDIDLRFVLKAIVALNSQFATVRECSIDILRAAKFFNNELSPLIVNLIEREEEIYFDAEQIPLIFFSILNSKKKSTNNSLITDILNIINDSTVCLEFKSKVMAVLKHVKSVNLLNSMIPVALSSLDNIQTVGNIQVLDDANSNIFKSVVTRFDENSIREVIKTNKNAWHLFEHSFALSTVFLNTNGKLTPVPSAILQILDEATYNQLPDEYKIKLLNLIVGTISLSNNDALFLDVNKALKKCSLDCKHVVPILEAMRSNSNENVVAKKKKEQTATTVDISLLNTKQWKDGIVLLEILENKKKLHNAPLLIPILFDILKKCLDMESQSPVEYAKQLVLSALNQCCEKSKEDNLQLSTIMSESVFRINLIVQCIRVTQNPQTHYNALLFLSQCASLFPQQVMHNLVDIFTFMGSSITRHDDAFSFQVISNIIELIIPILVADKKSKDNKRVVPVLKVFSDILLDVPEHRRTPLYDKLLSTLGAEKYFWLFLCVVFESQIINEEKNKTTNKPKNNSSDNYVDKLPKRLHIVSKLLDEFSVNVSIQTCSSLLAYVKRLPMDIEKSDNIGNLKSKIEDAQDNELFDVKSKTPRQLRHYKYLILQFVSTYTSSFNFLKAISLLNEEQNKQNKSLYQSLIITVLSYIPDVTNALEKTNDTTQVKFWKVILHHCYDILDNVISLLSPDMFLIAVQGLMQHKLVTIRKKVIELFINKIQKNNEHFKECSDENITNLLNSLSDLIGTISPKDSKNSGPSSNEVILVQQAGLIAIKILSKQFAFKHMEQFKSILEHLTEITKKRDRLSKIIVATVILTLVEIISNLKAHAIAHLPKFMPHLIDALQDQSTILQNHAPDNVCLALMTGVQKLFEAMPLFLGPYIVGTVSALSTMWHRIKNGQLGEQDQKKLINLQKLESIWKKMASEVPARVLIPNCEKSYYALMSDGNYSSISFLMKLFCQCVSNASTSDLSNIQKELTSFFLKCLEFRSQMNNSTSTSNHEIIASTEMEIINAFVAWILKLSESSFRPVYKKLYDWGFEADSPKERVLTYFILNKCISDSLKSLFIMFSSDFIEDAAKLLTNCNTSKNAVLFFENSDLLNVELVTNILATLANIFLYDTKGFSNHHRFDVLMQPIVDQLENKLILDNEELEGILLSCISQLAVVISNDVLWKQLHYQVLLKTRSNVPEVRIVSFNCCVELARKLGDDFSSLLPETVPFVAELFEDENPLVVKNTRRAVQEMESILGESLQKYF